MRRQWLIPVLMLLAIIVVAVVLVQRGPSFPVAKPVTTASGITLTLDESIYDDGDAPSAVLRFSSDPPAADLIKVALATTDGEDHETLEFTRSGNPQVYTATRGTVRIVASSPQHPSRPEDGELSLPHGQPIYALYFPDKSDPALASLQTDVVADIAFLKGAVDPAGSVNPAAALTEDEGSANRKPAGTLVRRDSLPVQIATQELILWARNEAELAAFLVRTGGRVLASRAAGPKHPGMMMHLVQLSAPADAAHSLSLLDNYLGERRDVLASNVDTLALLAYGLELRLDGFMVSPNPRLQPHAPPGISATETANVTRTMEMHGPSEPCSPGDIDPFNPNPCIENVPALWTFLSLWDFDDERINIGVLDQGFATNEDFRPPATGLPVECTVWFGDLLLCGPGFAQGVPTVGDQFFGDPSWHGNAIVHTIGGIVNNDMWVTGVGGQVAVPMLYRYDVSSYAFGIDTGIRDAVDRGASCINISAGFPCNVLTDFGDYDVCNWEGRLGMCAVVTASTAAVAKALCLSAAWTPLIGGAICGVAQGVLYVEVAACLTALSSFADLRGPVLGAIEFAADNGVPVIVSAGNAMRREQLPPVIRNFVNLGDWRVERWGVVPAISPEAIVVGSAVSAAINEADNPIVEFYRNTNFFGDSVDIWAPIRTRYAAPLDVNNIGSVVSIDEPNGDRRVVGGTSGAAAFMSGVVAAMQAANPELNPATPGLTNAQRGAIVQQITDILTDDANSFSNAELQSFSTNYADQPDERPVMVNPLAAVQAAAASAIPDFAGAGYDTNLNFNETADADTVPAAAEFNVPTTGTIVAIPEADGDLPNPDIDPYQFTIPASGEPLFEVQITLTYPDGYGELIVEGSDIVLASESVNGFERLRTYRALAVPGDTRDFVVRGATPDQDNVYKLMVIRLPAQPTVTITSPSD
ncbi:MAG: S8/S53 family peptidase, partial [Gammaproteobacteria bacterium]|nr:S8/S53 family peptidase [Gammaproteobacteria bacterium]